MLRTLRNLVIAALATVLVAAAANRVEAGTVLVENLSGPVTSGTTLGGTAISAGATFTVTADFDYTKGTPDGTGVEVFATTATITISGAGAENGTYTSAAGSVGVLTVGTGYGLPLGIVGIGLISLSNDNDFFGGLFVGATPTYVTYPTAATTFGPGYETYAQGTTSILLTNGETLAFAAGDPTTPVPTGSVTVAPNSVPEPATLICAAQAVLLLGLASGLRRRKKD
ncbi:MAG: hypothetical protein ACLQIB_18710 [Isosphaeraceae bacterium]